NRRVLALVVAAGILYVLQAVIGALVVILELPETWVTAHLANAELILAVLTILAVGVRWPATIAPRERSAPWTALLLAGAVGTFVLMLTGAYVRGDDATTACTTWPLCDDGSLPVFGAAGVHMAHRSAACSSRRAASPRSACSRRRSWAARPRAAGRRRSTSTSTATSTSACVARGGDPCRRSACLTSGRSGLASR